MSDAGKRLIAAAKEVKGMVDAPELKPCPFCGLNPKVDDHSEDNEPCFRIDHWCDNERVTGSFVAVEEDSYAEVALRWNTRADLTQAAVAAALEEVEICPVDFGYRLNRRGVFAGDFVSINRAIRALIPTTGSEALERIKEAVRAEQKEKDARIADRQAEVARSRGVWRHAVTASEKIAAAIREAD